MKIIVAAMVLLLSCGLLFAGKLRGPRVMGCREQVMRISESACQFSRSLLPTSEARPARLEVQAAEHVPVDVCLRKWEEVAKQCP